MQLTLSSGGASGQDSLTSSATQYHPLGTIGRDNFGGIYRYSQMGAVDSVAGNVYQSAVQIANHLAQTPPVVALGARTFQFTPGATAGAANLYAEGYLQVDTTPGNGYIYSVSGHPAIVSSTAFTLTLNEQIQVALTASSRVGLIHNPWKNVLVVPTTQTAAAAGFAVCIITATQYGWLKTRGPVSALINGTPAANTLVTPSATTAGAVDVITTTNLVTNSVVGQMMQTGVSTKNNFVMATIE